MDDIIKHLSEIKLGKKTADQLESATLDFKQPKDGRKETWQDIAEAAVCFANSQGGRIVVGVRDKPAGPDALVGTSEDAETMRERIYELTEPALLTEVNEIDYDQKNFLCIHVPQGIDVHQTRKSKPTRRLRDRCLAMSPSEIGRLQEERRSIDWSALSSLRPISDIDKPAVEQMRVLLRLSLNDAVREIAETPDEQLLQTLNLLHDDGCLTNAADILLCRPNGLKYSEMLVYQHQHTTGGEPDFVRRWGAPAIRAFSEAMDVMSSRIGISPVTVGSGIQMQIEDYPVSAVREALANAVVHGDHREGRPVVVHHSPEFLVVRSPGPLVSGVTPDNIITHPSKPRFRLLSEVFRLLGLMEKLGQGVDRMFREMIRSGKGLPVVEEHGQTPITTVVTFPGSPPNSRVAKFIAGLPEKEREDTDTLLITTVLCERKTVTANNVSQVIQRSPEQTEVILRRLSSGEAKLLEPTSGTVNRKNPSYRLQREALASLGPAVSYQKRPRENVEQKVIEHLSDYETINNRSVQRLFDIDVYQARDLIRDLVTRGFLEKVSVAERGTGVKYGPGDKFPRKKNPAKKQSPITDAYEDHRDTLF